MRISDWSSDVCSSDLPVALQSLQDCRVVALHADHVLLEEFESVDALETGDDLDRRRLDREIAADRRAGVVGIEGVLDEQRDAGRSEARRVGKECVSQFRSRW